MFSNSCRLIQLKSNIENDFAGNFSLYLCAHRKLFHCAIVCINENSDRINQIKMNKDDKYKSSCKELRFVTSAEQMLPFLDRIRGQSNDSDDPNDSDTNDSNELNENNENIVVPASDNSNLTVPMVAPKISASNTSEALALPNIYEEYVNFIDLSVLNPIVDAKHCQRDRLIESEISEPNCLIFMFNFDSN